MNLYLQSTEEQKGKNVLLGDCKKQQFVKPYSGFQSEFVHWLLLYIFSFVNITIKPK